MRNIIFVDIDGVLLPGKMHLFRHNQQVAEDFTVGSPKSLVPYFDPVAVRMFQLWSTHSSAQIVFSTTWAFGLQSRVDFVKHIMASNDLNFVYHDKLVTPYRITSNKLHNVGMWVDDYGQDGDNYLIVDDDYSLNYINNDTVQWLDNKNATALAIIPDYNDGLTWKHFKDGCKHLRIDNAKMLQLEYGIEPMSPRTREQFERDQELLYAFF
jgi:hypothetical protein